MYPGIREFMLDFIVTTFLFHLRANLSRSCTITTATNGKARRVSHEVPSEADLEGSLVNGFDTDITRLSRAHSLSDCLQQN